MKKSFIFIAIFSAMILGCSSNSSDSTNESTCQVHFVNYDGTLLYKTTVTKGGDVSYSGDIPTKPSTTSNYYRFEGWDGSLYNIKEDVTLTATYEKMDQILVDENGIKYSPLSETEYYISGYEETHASHLIIGDTFNSFPVVKIGAGAFANNTDITNVTIRNGIKYVGQKGIFKLYKFSVLYTR